MKFHRRHVDGGHLRRQHSFDLIPRLDSFDDGDHEIQIGFVDLRPSRSRACELLQQAKHECLVRRTQSVLHEQKASRLVRVVD